MFQPAYAEAHNNLGNVLKRQGKLEEAIVHYRQALALKPAYADAHNNLGNALRDQGNLEEAVAQYRRALALKPAYAGAHNNLGNALRDQGNLEEAVAQYRQALALKPDYAEAHNNLGIALSNQGRLHEAQASYKRALTIRPDDVVPHSNLIIGMIYDSASTPETIADELRKWNDKHARHLALRKAHGNDRSLERRLRVGYVSADFWGYAAKHFILPLLSGHNRARVEVFLYSNEICADATIKHLQGLCDVWRSIVGMSDEAVAELISGDEIDILVDLSGHTAGNRLLVFARNPAPVTVTYLSSLITTGLSTMDYRLTDRYLSPSDSPEWFSEELVRLPGCFVCYEPPTDGPPVVPSPAAITGQVTFGCFNNLVKVTPALVSLWAQILRSMPESRLVLKDLTLVDSVQCRRYLDLFMNNGIDEKRIELLPRTSMPDYLGTYGRIDIGLDPFPYNGCTTTCDALWMGVPVVTLAGVMSYSRFGVSLLSNLGLEEFIAGTPEEYVKKAVGLAKERKRLAALRAQIRPRMAAAVLCDAKAFAHGVEQAYRRMWRRWCRS